MKKIKVLLTGRNTTLVDDFFTQLSDVFECVTTSNRYDDILAHIKFYEPELFLYCMSDETRDAVTRVLSARQKLLAKNIPIAVYGGAEDLAMINANPMADINLVLNKPMNTTAIKERILHYMKEFEQQNSVGAAAAEVPEQNTKKHVLVIDDDPMMLKLIKEYLHEEYQVATAINGRTAFKFLESKSTDLILLDYEMPGDNGPTVLKQLRNIPKTAAIPVIFLTGITQKEKIQEALAQKPQGYLLKPIDHQKLMETIKKYI